MRRKTSTRLRRQANAVSSQLEPLEGRAYFAVTAISVRGILAVFGDNNANGIIVSRDAAGRLLVNHGAVRIVGARPTAATTHLINVIGFDGDDSLSLDETAGAIPRANLFGGNGGDTLTGGSGNDTLLGGPGNDFLFGAAGADQLLGGDGDDAFTGGAGDDRAFGQSGNDAVFWAPGDGSDVDEGGDGVDTLVVNGSADPETFAALPNGDRVLLRRTLPTTFALDIGTVENLSLRANGGDDIFTASDGLAPLIHLTIDGGTGDDALFGSDGADDLLGRDGNDLLVGNGANDLMLGGAGDDTFVWNPGDGSDTVEGQNDRDVLEFEGSNAAERFELSAIGTRARFTRDVGGVALDLNGLEELNLDGFGGADVVTVNDQSATGLNTVNIDLGGSGATSDAAAVIINGTDGNDVGQIRSIGARVNATISAIPFVNITGEGGLDTLTVNTRGGDDLLDASDLAATNASQLINLTINGGDGNDTLTGSQGNDTFLWNPGDGNDTIDGREGENGLFVSGSDDGEVFGVSASGDRLRFTRDLGEVLLDAKDVQDLSINALGGSDKAVVNDLSGTAVSEIRIDLAPTPGLNAGDGQPDSVIVNGTANGDLVPVVGINGLILVDGGFAEGGGLPYFMAIGAVEPSDSLQINGNGGDDTIDASTLQTSVNFRAEGRVGNDVLKGTPFDDILIGGDGNDVVDGNGGDDDAFLGNGDDLFVWDPGDGNDAVEGMDGSDTLHLNGGAGGEAFDLSAGADRLAVTRNNNGVVIDADDVEVVEVVPLGGQDNVAVNDLSPTDVGAVDVSLSSDLLTDRVVVNGSVGDDRIGVTELAGAPLVVRPTYAVRVTGADAAKDTLTVNGLGGNDTIDASHLPASMLLTLDGGDGNDTLTGGAGDDFLSGGPGDDLLIGGAGTDVLDGGTGNNVLLQ